jgi:hypothetical protein
MRRVRAITRTIHAYQAWAERPVRRRRRSRARRAGRRSAASPRVRAARAARLQPRRALRHARRARRRGRYPLAADAVHFVEDDATTLAAKRALVSGDRCCSSAGRASSRTPRACRSPRSTAGSRSGGAGRSARGQARRGRRGRPRPEIAAGALLERRPATPASRATTRDPGASVELLLLGCLALATLSLLLPSVPRTTRGRGSSGAGRSCTATS